MSTQGRLVDVKKIKSLMALKDHKQKDLAIVLDIAKQTINAKFKGHKEFTLKEVISIAEEYNVTVDDLLL